MTYVIQWRRLWCQPACVARLAKRPLPLTGCRAAGTLAVEPLIRQRSRERGALATERGGPRAIDRQSCWHACHGECARGDLARTGARAWRRSLGNLAVQPL